MAQSKPDAASKGANEAPQARSRMEELLHQIDTVISKEQKPSEPENKRKSL